MSGLGKTLQSSWLQFQGLLVVAQGWTKRQAKCPGLTALRCRGVRQRWGRRQVCHFVGKAGSLAARQPRRGGVLWDIYGRETSHFESFQSWTLRNVSHFESFEAWRPDKASHFESFGGWRPEKASHFESFGSWRLRKVSHGESFCGLGAVWPSAWRGAG